MGVNPAYDDSFDSYVVTNDGRANSEKPEVKTYSYEEAINLAGNGRYNIGLLGTLSIAILGLGFDMFGFSVIVTGCTCEFQLDMRQKSILLSMPFLGPIVTAYPWGYVSDTQGRKKSLLVGLWVSFLLSIVSAFSPNWIVLAVLKLVSTSFCSCAQSATFTLIGESCPTNVRDTYMFIKTSVLTFGFSVYMMISYGTLNLQFSTDLGFIMFGPWRLLAIFLALPLGISAFCLHFYYESPKFLLNAGRELEALDILTKIWDRNKICDLENYPVKKLVLNEQGNVDHQKESLVMSLWHQTVPLFKPPLLLRSLQLYYLTAVIYSISNSYFVWFPFLADSFAASIGSSSDDSEQGLCSMILTAEEYKDTNETMTCITKIDAPVAWSAVGEGVVFTAVNLVIAKLASRKKTLNIIILLISSVTAAGAMVIANNLVAFAMFFGLLLNGLCSGIVFSYFVDLYPTSYRGMAACLAVMVARLTALSGVNLVGAFITTRCHATFYSSSALLLSGVIVSCFLPPDKVKK